MADKMLKFVNVNQQTPFKRKVDTRVDDFEEIYSVNVKGTFFCSRAAIAQMRKNGKGHIINVASVAGLTGLGSSLVYSSSKAAVINLTKGLAYSQAPEIQVNCVGVRLIIVIDFFNLN